MEPWIKLDKTSGHGNDTLSISATENTGRDMRKGMVTIEGMGIRDKVTVTQAGKPEFVRIDSVLININDKTYTINGMLNSSKLTFSLGAGNFDINIPTTYEAYGQKTKNGDTILADFGAVTEIDFSITLTFSDNEIESGNENEKSRILIITTENGINESINLKKMEII